MPHHFTTTNHGRPFKILAERVILVMWHVAPTSRNTKMPRNVIYFRHSDLSAEPRLQVFPVTGAIFGVSWTVGRIVYMLVSCKGVQLTCMHPDCYTVGITYCLGNHSRLLVPMMLVSALIGLLLRCRGTPRATHRSGFRGL